MFALALVVCRRDGLIGKITFPAAGYGQFGPRAGVVFYYNFIRIKTSGAHQPRGPGTYNYGMASGTVFHIY